MDILWKSSSIIESFYDKYVTFVFIRWFFQKSNFNKKSGQISRSIECSFTKSMQSVLFTYLASIGSTKYPQKKRAKFEGLYKSIL